MSANINFRAHRTAVLSSPAADFTDHLLAVECCGPDCRRCQIRVGALVGAAPGATMAALIGGCAALLAAAGWPWRHSGQRWEISPGEVVRTKRLAAEGTVQGSLIGSAPRNSVDDRLVALVAGIFRAASAMTLQQIANQLDAMHERTPRSSMRWHRSSFWTQRQQAARWLL